jgi:hypothetical protein
MPESTVCPLSIRLMTTMYRAFTGTAFAPKLNSSHYAVVLCLAHRAEFTVEAARWIKPSAVATCCFGISANRTRTLLHELEAWGLIKSRVAAHNNGREYTLDSDRVERLLDVAAAARRDSEGTYTSKKVIPVIRPMSEEDVVRLISALGSGGNNIEAFLWGSPITLCNRAIDYIPAEFLMTNEDRMPLDDDLLDDLGFGEV